MNLTQPRSFPTALIGFGNISHGYLSDPLLTKYYKFLTHAQVLTSHPVFDWSVVIDPSESARLHAKNDWNIPHIFSSHTDSPEPLSTIEIAVVATPPHIRLPLIKSMPNLRAVLVEKPLGLTLQDSEEFIQYCNAKNILVQVNYWRRSDCFFRTLCDGALDSLVGKVQCAHVIYGNGLLNNGSHMIDFSRMLFGDLVFLPHSPVYLFQRCHNLSPIKDDIDASFSLTTLSNCTPIHFDSVDFTSYRENGITIWGTSGKLEILNEGLTIQYFPRSVNRSTSSCSEISHDQPRHINTTVDTALYELYSNLAASLCHATPLHSPGLSALKTSEIVNAIREAKKLFD